MIGWYYGQDGSQHGPVTEQTLRGKLRTGELSPDTLVWRTGLENWAKASTFPELNPTGAPANPYAAPTANPLPDGELPFDALVCLSRSWELFRAFAPVLIGMTLFMVAVSTVLGALEQSLMVDVSPYPMPQYKATPPSIAVAIVNNLIGVFFALGLTKALLKVVDRGPGPPEFKDLFAGGPQFLKCLGATLLFYLMVIGGLILLIVPGVFLFIRFGFFMQAMVDQDLGVQASLEHSWKMTAGHEMQVLFLWVLFCLLILVGLLAFCVGVLAALPLGSLAATVAYRWMTSGSDFAPPP